ncbi:hypothetical protein ACVIHH_002961 [Bradyrhizobium sp. USDA 4518]
MPRTTPHDYYDAFVRPNYDDYRQLPQDIRRGFNACVSASQLADIMIAYYEVEDPTRIATWKRATSRQTLRALRIDLCNREPYFTTVQSAATAYKHLHARGAHYDISTAGSLESVSIDPDGSLSIETTYDGPDVIVRRRDGSEVSLTAALEAVVERLWPSVLRVG